MSEADHILQKFLRVLLLVVHLEGKQAHTHNVISEDKGTENVGVLPVLLRSFI